MKLASYRDGTRDGQLVVVSRDLTLAHYATGVAATLQQALDDWNFIAPQLEDLSATLNQGKARHAFPFEPRMCRAPLPRPCDRFDGDAYPPSPAAPVQDRGDAVPHLRQASAGTLHGAVSTLALAPGLLRAELDAEAKLLLATGDLPAGTAGGPALEGVRLLMLALDVVAHGPDLGRRGNPARWPATCVAPVALTPDELGAAWHEGRAALQLLMTLNERRLGLCETGASMRHGWGALLAQACATRALGAGTLIGSGGVRDPGDPARGDAPWPRGHVCLADKRAVEAQADGQPSTPWLTAGDRIGLDARLRDGLSAFGAIELTLAAAEDAKQG